MDELTALRERHPRWRIWTSDTGWKYATCTDLLAPGTGTTLHGKTSEALSSAIDQAEADAAKMREGHGRKRSHIGSEQAGMSSAKRKQ